VGEPKDSYLWVLLSHELLQEGEQLTEGEPAHVAIAVGVERIGFVPGAAEVAFSPDVRTLAIQRANGDVRLLGRVSSSIPDGVH
jgi:hypothetical protein